MSMYRIRSTMIVALALGLATAAAAATAGAQQASPTRPDSSKAGAQSRQGGRHLGQRRNGKGAKAGRGLDRAALRGVALTDAQKQQMQALREKYKAEAKPIAERMRPALADARAARQKGDTAAARAAFARTEADRTAMQALHERQRAEALTLLTPEQRAKVDANVKTMKDKRAARPKSRRS
jgi:Spy/CpxP family protein refolding chaperone